MLRSNRALALILALAILGAGPVRAQDETRAFIFGNSLINHATESSETTMPYWLHHLAQAGGHGFAVDGTWGFLRNFAADLPPEPAWSFDGVPGVWDAGRLAFRRAGFNTIIINPANFIQNQPPDVPFEGDNPGDDTPLAATLRVFDWSAFQAPGARFFVFEGWSDMAGFTNRFPPNARALRRYQAFNAGAYHDWYVAYVDQLRAARPDLDIALIPVASVVARVLEETPLSDLDALDLYSDDAPHGTPTLYFLAAMISYAALYDAPPPEVAMPDSLHPLLRANYTPVAAVIWQAVSGAALPQERALAIPETGLANPALAMGLNGIADWSSQMPFLDVMKSARPWVGHLDGQWGGMDAAELQAGGYLDENGWPLAIPDGVVALETFLLTGLPAEAASAAGRYRVTWQGGGAIDVGGDVRDIARREHEIWFTFQPGGELVYIRIEALDAADPIRDITVVHQDNIPLFELGEVFNPDWIALVRDLRVLRFMDWMFTNGSPQVTWQDRPRPGDFTYVWRGVPVEVMVRLVNEVGADPWFNIPHMADDAYVTNFATVVHDTLSPDLRVYVEYSNELWNFLFPQAHWAGEQAQARWGDNAGLEGWLNFAGMRAAEVADIWAGVYGAEAPARLVRVIATHTGWPGLEEAILTAPLAQAEGRAAPAESFDAYAVSGYFGHDLGGEDMAPDVRRWIGEGDAARRADAALRRGSFRELVEDLFPFHARVAAEHGLQLVMYEGGTHVVAHGEVLNDPEITDFFTRFSYSPEMAQLYADLLTGWQGAGGTLFNAFVDVATPAPWGSWGALRHLDDMNPRWATLMAWNAGGAPWEHRAPGTFTQGVLRRGGAGADDLDGTDQGDVLLGLAGNDTLHAGPGDRAHGGPGRDRAILPGLADSYQVVRDGAATILTGSEGSVRLVAVEELSFADAPEVVYSLEIVGVGE